MKPITKHLFTLLRLGIAVGLLAYLGISGNIDWAALTGLLVAWSLTLAALLLWLLGVVVMAWRLCILMQPQELQLSLQASIRLTLLTVFFNTFLPGSTGGEIIRIYYASAGNKGRRTEIITIMLLDRIIGLFALIIWPLMIVPFFPRLIRSSPLLSSLIAIAAGFALLMVAGWFAGSASFVRESRFVLWVFRHLPMGKYAERVFETIHTFRRNTRTLLAAVGISLLSNTIAITILFILAEAIIPSGFVWEMGILIPLGMLANAIPLTPGGLGVGEATLNTLFDLAGLDGGAEILLGWRILVIIVGLLGLAVYLRGRGSFVQSASTQPNPEQNTAMNGLASSGKPSELPGQ